MVIYYHNTCCIFPFSAILEIIHVFVAGHENNDPVMTLA